MKEYLYKEYTETYQELIRINDIINQLIEFVEVINKKPFSIEGINAVKRIKEYLLVKEEQGTEIRRKTIHLNWVLKNTCKHQVLINREDTEQLICLICQKRFYEKNAKFPHLLLEDINVYEESDLRKMIYNMCFPLKEQDLDEISNHIKMLPKARIYRRNI